MGSGCFPSEGCGKASFFRHLKLGAASYTERDADNPGEYMSRPECYDLQISGTPFLLGVSWIHLLAPLLTRMRRYTDAQVFWDIR
ncbi:uncharacterized protein J3R85_015277 [Psidium guajava]|nr:uncharacterized protein J3R85_015277 [Psidium guajava]